MPQAYRREFGFTLDRPVLVDDVRVRAAGRAKPMAGQQTGQGNGADGNAGE